MIAIVVPIVIIQNADTDIPFTFVQGNKQPFNLFGCRVHVQIRREKSLTSDLLYEFDSDLDDGSCVFEADAGIAHLIVPREVAESLNWDNPAYYDGIVYYTNGKSDRFASGKAYLSEGVTV